NIHQVNTVYAASDPAAFSFIANLIGCVFSAVLYTLFTLAEKKKPTDTEQSENGKISAKGGVIALLILANAACNGISYTLQLISAGKVDASAMYPMMTGGSVVLSALAGLVFFREKPDKISLIGILLAFAATFLFLV
ncbi:MAG: EamA family transporter, partial [Clostridia bacterium]|nr:EamA family transporter [Clostridia bacterium]